MARIAPVRPSGIWSSEMVPGAGDYGRFDINQSLLINGDLGGSYAPSGPIVIGGLGGFTSSVATMTGGVRTATAGRVQIAASAGDMPALVPARTRTVTVPIFGNVVSPADFSGSFTPGTFTPVYDDVNGWGIKVTGGNVLVIEVPGKFLHVGAQLVQASLTYVIPQRPTAVPTSPMYLVMYALSDSNVQSYANPSFLTNFPTGAFGNIDQWAATHAFTSGTYVVPLANLPSGPALYYKCTTAGTSSGTEPTWPTTVGTTVTDGSAVWTCTGLLGVSLGGGETVSSYWANGAPQSLTFQYDGAGAGSYSNIISVGLRYAFVISEMDPTILITGLKLTFADISTMAFE